MHIQAFSRQARDSAERANSELHKIGRSEYMMKLRWSDVEEVLKLAEKSQKISQTALDLASCMEKTMTPEAG